MNDLPSGSQVTPTNGKRWTTLGQRGRKATALGSLCEIVKPGTPFETSQTLEVSI
jgi:hypothetical protein